MVDGCVGGVGETVKGIENKNRVQWTHKLKA